MKTIEIFEKKIELNCGENLTVKEMRLIYPFTVNMEKGQELETIVNIVKALSSQPDVEEIINSMNMEEFTILSEKVAEILNQKKK